MAEAAHLPTSRQWITTLQAAGMQARDPSQTTMVRVTAALRAVETAVALEMHTDALHYARLAQAQAQDREQEAQVSHFLGVALLDADSATEAEGALLHALSMEDTNYVQEKRSAILYNLALIYQRQRDDNNAITVYQQAAAAFLATGQHQDAAHAYQNAAWLALLARKVNQARTLLLQATELIDTDVPGNRAQQHALEAYACCLSGDGTGAIVRIESILSDDRTLTTPWTRALAFATAAEMALNEGRHTLAAGYVAAGQEQAVSTKNPRLLNLLIDLRKRAAI